MNKKKTMDKTAQDIFNEAKKKARLHMFEELILRRLEARKQRDKSRKEVKVGSQD